MSFGSYGKVDLVEQASHDASRRSKRRIIIIALCTVALVAIVVGVVVGTRKSCSDDTSDNPNAVANIRAVCSEAENPDSCFQTLSALSRGEAVSLPELYKLSVQIAMRELSNATLLFEKLKASGKLDAFLSAAADSCKELLGMAIERLNETLSSGEITAESVDDFRTWLSATITYQDTCLEGFANASASLRTEVEGYLRNSTEFSGNSLAIIAFLSDTFGSVNIHRRLLQVDKGYPSWVSATDRKLLAAAADPRANADIVVAQNGTGKFKSINAALKALPKGGKRTIIYVKKGIYKENVVIDKGMTNVMIVGDGKDLTVITGSLNFVDGTPTFKSATLAIFGRGFIGRSFAVQNSAGATKQQAVAMMSDSDHSVFYDMKLDGFQDTLYTHTMRQFYRECDIYGTVDFIFGNAAVVLQGCNILPRVPLPGQPCTLTAQGRMTKNQNTGTSIHNCTVTPFGDLTGVHVYLGRPWKNYSTTVYLKSNLPSVIDPAGWMAWIPNVEPPKTVFYAEYLNSGPGALTTGRVKWKGVRTLNEKTAAAFAVDKFIGGKKWLPDTAVPYVGTL